MPDANTAPTYDRTAIFHEDGPFDPHFMAEAVRTLMRTLPLDPDEPQGWQDRRMHSALLGLSALHPRDEIEVMFGVQAMAAYHSAAACFRLGMNHHRPNGDSTRHVTAACSAARTFDTMIRALERRQAKPLAIPLGRPAARIWNGPHPTPVIQAWSDRCLRDPNGPEQPKPEQPKPEQPKPEQPAIVWTAEAIAATEAMMDRERIEKENAGLDIANTEGILPSGGMILPDEPTPQQTAYMGRRLALMYRREYAERQRKGIKGYPKIRGIHPGDLIP
jgi:hypothetical protein